MLGFLPLLCLDILGPPGVGETIWRTRNEREFVDGTRDFAHYIKGRTTVDSEAVGEYQITGPPDPDNDGMYASGWAFAQGREDSNNDKVANPNFAWSRYEKNEPNTSKAYRYGYTGYEYCEALQRLDIVYT